MISLFTNVTNNKILKFHWISKIIEYTKSIQNLARELIYLKFYKNISKVL